MTLPERFRREVLIETANAIAELADSGSITAYRLHEKNRPEVAYRNGTVGGDPDAAGWVRLWVLILGGEIPIRPGFTIIAGEAEAANQESGDMRR